MGKTALTQRNNWQTNSGKLAEKAEDNFYLIFENYFQNSNFVLHRQPKHLKKLYSTVQLPNEILSQIYTPNIDIAKQNWGVKPDFAIENTKTKKIIFGEIKRQDGWVEGKSPNAGRGMHMSDFANFFLLDC